MDYEELIDVLEDAYETFCKDNGREPDDSECDAFVDMADRRIEDMMTGGLDIGEAFEMYQEEMADDLAYITKRE